MKETKKEEFKPVFLVMPFLIYEDTRLNSLDKFLIATVLFFTNLKNNKCTVSNATLARVLNSTEKSIQNSILRCEKYGYIQRIFKDDSNRVRLEIKCNIPMYVPPVSGDVPPVSGTHVPPVGDQKSNIYKNNNKDIGEVIQFFEELDPKNKNYYGNKTQRLATDFILSQYGKENIILAIDFIKKNRGKPFFPSVTSPFELQEKWVKLIEFGLKNSVNNKQREFI